MQDNEEVEIFFAFKTFVLTGIPKRKKIDERQIGVVVD